MTRCVMLAIFCAQVVCCNSPSRTPDGLPPDALLGDSQATATVCQKGGAFDFGQVSLDIPEGAIEQCVSVIVEEATDVPPGHLGPAYRIFTDGGETALPVGLTIRLAKDSVPFPYDYSELLIAALDDVAWVPKKESNSHVDDGLITFQAEKLGVFGIVPRVKIDVLLVTENGHGMGEESVALAATMDSLVEQLEGAIPNPDLHIASVSRESAITGEFVPPETTSFYPVGLGVRRLWDCQLDADCEAAFGEAWTCISGKLAGNGSSWTGCTARGCKSDADCCLFNCTEGPACQQSPECPNSLCELGGPEGCLLRCASPGSVPDNSLCVPVPLEVDCSGATSIISVAPIDAVDETDHLPCILQPESGQDDAWDRTFLAAWRCLDPTGPNAEVAASFMRPDALLVLIFIAYDDECTVHPDYASPNYDCESEDDCSWPFSRCEVDKYYSALEGKTVKLCHGLIKKDYGNNCSVLGNYVSPEHRDCALDLDCQDCQTDADCPHLWVCNSGNKCRMVKAIDSDWVASFQSPSGTPLFSLWSPDDFRTRMLGLKEWSGQLLVSTIVGDGLPYPDDGKAYISEACLAANLLTDCQAYLAASQSATAACRQQPDGPGCEGFLAAKMACIRECYDAAKMDIVEDQNGSVSQVRPLVCRGKYGFSELGSRYIQLVEAMGDQGVHTNLCHPEGIPHALERTGDLILRRVLGE